MFVLRRGGLGIMLKFREDGSPEFITTFNNTDTQRCLKSWYKETHLLLELIKDNVFGG